MRAVGVTGWTRDYACDLAELEQRGGAGDRALEVILECEREADPAYAPLAALKLSVQHGRLLRLNGDETARDMLLGALGTADSFGARWLGLEVAIELALLHEAAGEKTDAINVLGPRYEWFGEGFDTPLLVGAREILERL